MKKNKKIPIFRSEAEERKFWETHDFADYMDLAKFEPVDFPNLRPTTKAISIRLPEILLADLRSIANKRDVPYQSLIKMYLSDKVKEELAA